MLGSQCRVRLCQQWNYDRTAFGMGNRTDRTTLAHPYENQGRGLWPTIRTMQGLFFLVFYSSTIILFVPSLQHIPKSLEWGLLPPHLMLLSTLPLLPLLLLMLRIILPLPICCCCCCYCCCFGGKVVRRRRQLQLLFLVLLWLRQL